MNDEYEGFCIDCDRVVPLIFKKRKVEQTEKGISFSYAEGYAICMHCGNEVYVPHLNDRNAKARASAYFEEKERQHVKKDQTQNNYAYLCDLKQCQDCTYPECSHTTDIYHRLTKEGCKLTEMQLVGSTKGINYYMEVFKKWRDAL